MKCFIRNGDRGVEFGFYDDEGYEMDPTTFYDAVFTKDNGYFVVTRNGVELLSVSETICAEG